MNHGLQCVVLLMFVLFSSMTAGAQGELQKHYSDEELIEMLKDDGFRAVELTEERVIKIRVDGLPYFLYIYDDDDLQLYFGLTGYSVDVNAMNDWNRTRRLSRAYIDDENDPVLEADLLANAGYTKEQFLEWFKVFTYSVLEFRQFLIEKDADD